MKISRMIDFYYNAPIWQKVFRALVMSDADFIREFALYLDHIMVLNSPLSQERRGVILYEYCTAHHPDFLTDVSIAWIEAGCSLHKKPAGDIIKIKNLQAFLDENSLQINIRYGVADASHRYFYLKSTLGGHLFGFDSQQHQPSPVFMADVCKL